MTNSDAKIAEMFTVGAHFGYSKASRHSSVQDSVFGTKDGVQVIDLEKTAAQLESAQQAVKNLSVNGGKIVFVGSKNEAKDVVKDAARELGMPYVNTRWIGGTLTNFSEIKKRITKLAKMMTDREKGEYDKYNKKEKLDLDKEIEKLQKHYTGLLTMTELPKALIVIDSKAESIAVKEASDMNIPVISLSNTDCDISLMKYPIVANDGSKASIEYFIAQLKNSFSKKDDAKEEKKETKTTEKTETKKPTTETKTK